MKLLDKTIVIYGTLGLAGAVSFLALMAAGVSAGDFSIYVATVAALLVGLAAFFDSFGLLCVVLAWLPFSLAFLNIEIGVITFSPYVLGINFLAILLMVRVQFKKIKYGFNLFDFIIGLLCLTYLISTLLSENILDSGHLAFHAIFVPVVSYFVVKGMVRTEAEYRKAMVFYIGGIVIFSVLAIFQFIATHERVVVAGIEPIGVATFAITGFMVLAYSGWWKNWLGLPALLVTLGALLASLSRLYLVSFFVAPLLFRYIKKGRAFTLILFMLVVSLVATISLSYNPDGFKPKSFDVKAESTLDRVTSLDYWKGSLYQRAFHYREAIENFIQHPITGTGLYSGEIIITRHNFHVAWLEYGGIIGYLLYVLVFVIHFWSIGIIAVKDRFCSANLLIIFIILTNGLTNGFMHGFMPYVVFILMGFNEARLKLWRLDKIES